MSLEIFARFVVKVAPVMLLCYGVAVIIQTPVPPGIAQITWLIAIACGIILGSFQKGRVRRWGMHAFYMVSTPLWFLFGFHGIPPGWLSLSFFLFFAGTYIITFIFLSYVYAKVAKPRRRM